MEGGQEPFGRLWHFAGGFNGRNSQGAFVAGITRRTVRWTPINRFEIWSSKLGALGSRSDAIVSGCGGAFQPRPGAHASLRSSLVATSASVTSGAASSSEQQCCVSDVRAGSVT